MSKYNRKKIVYTHAEINNISMLFFNKSIDVPDYNYQDPLVNISALAHMFIGIGTVKLEGLKLGLHLNNWEDEKGNVYWEMLKSNNNTTSKSIFGRPMCRTPLEAIFFSVQKLPDIGGF